MTNDYTPTFDPAITSVIHRVISAYTADKPISRGEWVTRVKAVSHRTDERQIRDAIKFLRRAGSLICSAPGTHGGYYMARDMGDFIEFDRTEFGAKIADMSETRAAMRQAAEREFGELQQTGLF